MATILVEGFDSDALALGRFLAAEGHPVRIAGSGAAPPEERALVELGIAVEAHADLDRDPGAADIAYLDVWTPEVAPRVARLRAQGSRVSCLGDLLLERWRGPTIGITGTAGKTSTTALVAAFLGASGIETAVSAGARAGNLWPTADLVGRLEAGDAGGTLLLELTSSHLAFMSTSPGLAAVVSFWPDHLELHGGLDGYRAAKETIVRYQGAGDLLVFNADDASASFARAAPGGLVAFSRRAPVERGAYLEPDGGLALVDGGETTLLGALPDVAPHPANIVAAAAIARAAGADPQAVAWGIADASAPLPYRAAPAGTVGGVAVIDDGMAATPGKAAAALAAHPDRSVVLIAGGLLELGAGPVHAMPEERALLAAALDEAARAARLVVLFGPAADRLEPMLQERGVRTLRAEGLDEAVRIAATNLDGAAAWLFSPIFPISLEDRMRFADLTRLS